jgi:alginate O-acetyltransferase complex protein AlgI
MVFSSVIFLFFFFPIFLALYFILPLLIPGKRLTRLRIKNFILFITSILFYSWGEKLLVLVMLTSTVIDYFCGLMGIAPMGD